MALSSNYAGWLRGRHILLGVLAIAAVVVIGGVSGIQGTPRSLTLNFGAHRAVSAIMQLSLNDRMVIDRSQKGRNEGSTIDYMDGQGDVLDFAVAWYDIADDQGYAARFRLHASDLSLIGETGHAAVRIVVGPGADVTATTTNAEAARLIRERRGGELPSLAGAPDIVLAEICADALGDESPVLQSLKSDADLYKGSQQRALNDQGRTDYLARNGPVVARCVQNES